MGRWQVLHRVLAVKAARPMQHARQVHKSGVAHAISRCDLSYDAPSRSPGVQHLRAQPAASPSVRLVHGRQADMHPEIEIDVSVILLVQYEYNNFTPIDSI